MKKIIAMLLVLAMALALVACGASAPAATEAPKAEEPKTETPVVETPAEAKKYEGVELTYWSMWNEAEPQGKVIVEAVAAFEAETGAKVNVEWKGRDLNTVITAALEAKENVDIFDDDYARITTAYAAHTYDLTEMAEAAGYADYSYACFNDFVVKTAGYLNCIVEQPQIGGIFYNKDAFAEAGIETVPTTWAEFLDVCEALKAAGIAPLALDSAYSNFNYYFHLTRHLGEAKIAELGKNGGWAEDEAAVAAAQEIIDFVNAGYLAEGAPDAYPASQTKVGLAPLQWSSALTTSAPRSTLLLAKLSTGASSTTPRLRTALMSLLTQVLTLWLLLLTPRMLRLHSTSSCIWLPVPTARSWLTKLPTSPLTPA